MSQERIAACYRNNPSGIRTRPSPRLALSRVERKPHITFGTPYFLIFFLKKKQAGSKKPTVWFQEPCRFGINAGHYRTGFTG
jgi:hypothetical protein